MGRFLVITVAVGLTVFSLSAKWGGFITGGVAGILIGLSVHASTNRAPYKRATVNNAEEHRRASVPNDQRLDSR
jgi:hypothetical protein